MRGVSIRQTPPSDTVTERRWAATLGSDGTEGGVPEHVGHDQLLLWIRTARRGRLLIGRIEASVLTSMALPSFRAIWRAYIGRPTVLTVSIRLAGEP